MSPLLLSLILSCPGSTTCNCDHHMDATKTQATTAGDAKAGAACDHGSKDDHGSKGKDTKAGECCKHGAEQAAKSGESCEHGAMQATAPAAAPAKGDTIVRGEKLKGLKPVMLDEVLSKPASYDGKTVAVEGKVRRACEKKGCWMELATDKGAAVRVTFKDYGFFVPLDSAGATAKVEGTIKVAELTEANAKHLASEGATVPAGKAKEVQLVASGVELRR